MVNTTCSVYGCLSTSNGNKDLKFHRFPQGPRGKSWINACQRPDLRHKTATQLGNMHVCSLHFESWMYKKKNLKTAVIPILNLPTSIAQNEAKDRQAVEALNDTMASSGIMASNIDRASTAKKKKGHPMTVTEWNTMNRISLSRVTSEQSKNVVQNIHKHFLKRKQIPSTWEFKVGLDLNAHVAEMTGLTEVVVQQIVQGGVESGSRNMAVNDQLEEDLEDYEKYISRGRGRLKPDATLKNIPKKKTVEIVQPAQESAFSRRTSRNVGDATSASSSGAFDIQTPELGPSEEPEEAPVNIKLEVEDDDFSEHEEDVLEQLENRKRLRENDPKNDPIATYSKKIKVELGINPEDQAEPQYEIVVHPTPQLQEQSQSQYLVVAQPQSTGPSQSQSQPQAEKSSEPVMIPEFFMSAVVRNQTEILTILKRQVLLQDPDPELLTFLRFLGSKMLRFPKRKREELQDRITELILLE